MWAKEVRACPLPTQERRPPALEPRRVCDRRAEACSLGIHACKGGELEAVERPVDRHRIANLLDAGEVVERPVLHGLFVLARAKAMIIANRTVKGIHGLDFARASLDGVLGMLKL